MFVSIVTVRICGYKKSMPAFLSNGVEADVPISRKLVNSVNQPWADYVGKIWTVRIVGPLSYRPVDTYTQTSLLEKAKTRPQVKGLFEC